MKRIRTIAVIFIIIVTLFTLAGCPALMNKPPTISIDDQTVNEGDTLKLNLNNYASDPDGDTLTYKKISGVGNLNNYTYTYSPGYEDEGQYLVRIEVSDGEETAETSFMITVMNTNRNPDTPKNPFPADNSDNITLNPTLSWDCTDPDGDTLVYDVYFGTADTPPLVVSDRPYSDYNPGTLNEGETYYWKIKAKDGNGGETTSDIWSFTTEDINESPTITKISGPSGTIDESSVTFIWSGNDPNGTIDHYEYRKDGSSWVNYGTNESFTWNGYTEGEHTFEVRAQDNDGAYSDTINWSFTYQTSNEPPEQPSNPFPTDGSTNNPIDTTLSWDCSDSDGDSLTYDVYFGTSETPTLVVSDITSKNYTPGTLNYAETYYWKVVASDGQQETESPKWEFTTQGEETFDQLKNQSYYDGTLIVSDDSLNQVEKGMIIRVKTSGEYYGYIKISDFPDDLIFDYAIYENEDTFLNSGSETLQIGEKFDLDDDGINDIHWMENIETTSYNQYKIARFTGRRYIHFIYDIENDIGCLYSADVISESGLIRFDAEDGNITTSSENYDLYEGVTADASKVAFTITEDLPDYKIGDVIVDYKTKELRKIIAEPEYHGNYVVLYTERANLAEAYGKLNISFSGNLSEAEQVSGIYPQDQGVGYSFEKDITLINESSGGKSINVGLQAKAGFNLELIYELELGKKLFIGFGNYVNHLKAGLRGEFNFETTLKALIEYTYEKSGHTAPFLSPSFYFAAGPVPIEVEMNIYAGYVFSADVTGQATMGCRAEYISDFGIECINDDWEIYDHSDGSFEMIGPELSIKGGVTIRPHLMIETSIQVAFAAGPFFGLSPYMEGNTQASYSNEEEPIVELSLNAGFSGTGGVLFDFLGFRKIIPDPSNPWQIFDIKKEIWSGEFAWPNAPTNLTATANETSITLQWSDESYVEDGFELYKKVGNEEYCKLVDLNSNTTSYTDNDIILDKNHYYKIRAYSEVPSIDMKIPSLWSNEASAYPSENEPPVITKVSGPSGTIDESSSTFTWDGNDPDGTIDHYEYRKDGGSWVSYGTSESLTWSEYSEGEHTFEVRAQDNDGAYSNTIIWNFTYEISNNDPDTPSNPNPSNYAQDVSISPTLSWDCSDPDGDSLTYDIYFGTSSNPPLKKTGHTSKSYNPGTLSYETTYYWKIKAKDGKGGETTGYIWRFTIKEELTPPTGEMVLVEGGTFQMGDTWGDGYSDEKPVHEVTLTYDFYIGKYEITNEEYVEFLNDKGINEDGSYNGKELIDMDDEHCQIKHSGYEFYIPSDLKNNPVIEVSWWGGIYYCNWLSEKEGLTKAYDNKGNLLDKYGNVTTDITKVQGYRLPTEAEWEYTARGGNESNGYKYAGSDDPDEVAWYRDNSGGHTHEVGTKKPNELGIYDMSGNVYEWCQDWYDSDYYEISSDTNPYNYEKGWDRVERGGCWGNDANHVRVANRNYHNPDNTKYYGFRFCRTVY